MRFAYVAASAVVLGAAVSEARSVPSSPQRTPKSAKRQSRPGGHPQIQPLMYTNSPMMKASPSKAIPFSLKNQVDDGIEGSQMVNNPPHAVAPPTMLNQPSIGDTTEFPQLAEAQLPNAQAIPSIVTLPSRAGEFGGPERMEIVNVNPTGMPEYAMMKVEGSQGELPTPILLGNPRRYHPSPLGAPAYIVQTEGGAIPEPMYYIDQKGKSLPGPVGQTFEDIYSSAPFSQGESMPQALPISAETPTDAFNQVAMTPSNGPPPPPLLRVAQNDNKLPVDQPKILNTPEIIKPSINNTSAPGAENVPLNELPAPTNITQLPSQAPAPVFRTAQISADTAASQNGTSLPSPPSPPSPPPSLPSNETAPSADAKASTEDDQRATLSTPTGSNATIDPSLSGNVTDTMASNVTASPSSLPLNTTDTPMPPSLPSTPSPVPN